MRCEVHIIHICADVRLLLLETTCETSVVLLSAQEKQLLYCLDMEKGTIADKTKNYIYL